VAAHTAPSIGFVPQDTLLIRRDCRRQHRFGLPNTTTAVREPPNCSLHGDVQDFGKAYETMVGERGITLSGGQNTRRDCTRVVRDPRILIPTSSLERRHATRAHLNGLRESCKAHHILISHTDLDVRDAIKSSSWSKRHAECGSTMNSSLARIRGYRVRRKLEAP